MRAGIGNTVVLVATLHLSAAYSIEYNEPEPVQKFSGNGWLINSGNDHGIDFKSFLETKRLLVTPDAIYYTGIQRVETIERGTPSNLKWNFRARCAVRPDMPGKIPVGIYSSQENETEQFTEVKSGNAPNNASRGWYTLWWAACKGVAKKF
jgi:hypothetical protein